MLPISRTTAIALIRWSALTVFALLTLVGTPRTAAAQGAASVLSNLPQETSLVVRCSNMQALAEKAKKSPLWRLMDNPQMKDTTAQFKAQIDKAVAEVKRELGFDPIDLVTSFQGEAVIAVGALEGFASKLGSGLAMGQAGDVNLENLPLVVAADAGSSGQTIRGYLDKLFAFAEKEGAIRETVSVRDGKITILRDAESTDARGEKADAKPPKSAERKNPGEPSQDESEASDPEEDSSTDSEPFTSRPAPSTIRLYFGESGTRFFFSTSRAFLEQVMAGKGAPGAIPLTSSALFNDTRKMAGDGDVFLYVNVKQLTNSIGSALSATPFAFIWQKVERILFGKSWNTAAVSYQLEDRGIKMGFFLHNSGAGDGLLGILQGPSFASTPPSIVPKDAQVFSSMSFNAVQLGNMIKEIAEIAMSFTQPGADVNVLFEQMLGVKLKDLIDGFGARIHYFARAARASGGGAQAENPMASLNYLVDLKSDAPLKRLIEKANTSMPGALKTEKYKDKDILVVPIPTGGELAISVTGNLLIVAGSKQNAQAVIDRIGGEGAGLAENAEVMKLLSSVAPAQVCALSYSSKDYMSSTFANLSKTLGGAADPQIEAALSVLSAFGEALGASAGYARWTDTGFHGESMLLYK